MRRALPSIINCSSCASAAPSAGAAPDAGASETASGPTLSTRISSGDCQGSKRSQASAVKSPLVGSELRRERHAQCRAAVEHQGVPDRLSELSRIGGRCGQRCRWANAGSSAASTQRPGPSDAQSCKGVRIATSESRSRRSTLRTLSTSKYSRGEASRSAVPEFVALAELDPAAAHQADRALFWFVGQPGLAGDRGFCRGGNWVPLAGVGIKPALLAAPAAPTAGKRALRRRLARRIEPQVVIANLGVVRTPEEGRLLRHAECRAQCGIAKRVAEVADRLAIDQYLEAVAEQPRVANPDDHLLLLAGARAAARA